MPRIRLVTGSDMPHADEETPLVATALAELDADPVTESWRGDGHAGGPFDLTVIRTPWDYPSRRHEFLRWVRAAEAEAPVLNPPSVLAWNSHKGYLVELAERGVPVLPTTLLRAGADPLHEGWDGDGDVVVKPAVGSGARGAARFAPGERAAARAHAEVLLAEGDALVQPFAESVLEGERSLVFLGGGYSHAVRKVPKAGDYRVQAEHGGSIALHEPPAAEREAAGAALAAVEADLLYARVDLVDLDERPVVIELELIEPELFLGHAPGAAERLARAMLERV